MTTVRDVLLPERQRDRNGVHAPRVVRPRGASRCPSATRLVLVAVLGAPLAARAQPVATEAPPRPAHPPAGIGGALAVGWAGSGWLARLDYDVLPVMAPDGSPGPVLGFVPGIELWRAAPDWGFAIPLGFVVGLRVFPVRATIGVGFDALLVDTVNDDTGLGLWAPFATASAGLDVHGFRLGVDGRVVRRWQLGADDFTQWQLAIFAGRTWGTPDRRAITPADGARP